MGIEQLSKKKWHAVGAREGPLQEWARRHKIRKKCGDLKPGHMCGYRTFSSLNKAHYFALHYCLTIFYLTESQENKSGLRPGEKPRYSKALRVVTRPFGVL